MPSSYYLLNGLLNGVLRGPLSGSVGPSWAQPNATYVALFTSAPGADYPTTPGTEVSTSGTGYTRQLATFNAPSNGAVASALDITFPQATTSWGTLTAFGIFDSVSGGNLLYFAGLSVSRDVLSGDQVKFPAGQLTVTGT